MLEFDEWITPTLGEIKDSGKFSSERQQICEALDSLASKTRCFATVEDSVPEKIAESVIGHIAGKSLDDSACLLQGVFSLLFLVTGKSDNNCKCQFPVFLRDTLKWQSFPRATKSGSGNTLQKIDLPRVLDDTVIAKTVASMTFFPKEQKILLSTYLAFLLNEDVYIRSLWALGNTYFRLKAEGLHEDFLMPMVVYRVRGSVSASGGHEPEAMLRERLSEWGLQPGIDFNTADVVVGKQILQKKAKTRAYDFVLPYKTPGWDARIFIQCQFYAGDSGSVSHKNVDQIRATRDFTKKTFKNSLFAEYLDGAGYFASLKGDLRRILQMRDTHLFFQVRSSSVKLRAALQQIGFLTPLEVVHAWALQGGSVSRIRNAIVDDGYSSEEFGRVLDDGIERGAFSISNDLLQIADSLRTVSRKYMLLDFIAITGKTLGKGRKKGTLTVPGFGPSFGVTLSAIVDDVLPNAGVFGREWATGGSVLKDIESLVQSGWIEQR